MYNFRAEAKKELNPGNWCVWGEMYLRCVYIQFCTSLPMFEIDPSKSQGRHCLQKDHTFQPSVEEPRAISFPALCEFQSPVPPTLKYNQMNPSK